MNCSACGKPNTDDVSFCEFCGAAMQSRPISSGESAAAQVSPSQLSNRATLEGRAEKAMARYRDGYRIARSIDSFGFQVKVVALLVGGLLAFGGVKVLSGNGSNGFDEGIGLGVIVIGLLAGGIGFVLGVLVQSAGQSMKAHFDCAVNGSHFLDDNQRAKVMSLE